MTNHRRAFTLIELMVVIAIIGLLSSIVLASISTARAKAQYAGKLESIKEMANALELYYNTNGNYPISNPDSTNAGAYFCSTSVSPPGSACTDGHDIFAPSYYDNILYYGPSCIEFSNSESSFCVADEGTIDANLLTGLSPYLSSVGSHDYTKFVVNSFSSLDASGIDYICLVMNPAGRCADYAMEWVNPSGNSCDGGIAYSVRSGAYLCALTSNSSAYNAYAHVWWGF